MSIKDKAQNVLNLKNQLAENLSAIGVEASTDEGLESLVPKVLELPIAVGEVAFDNASSTFTISELKFVPTVIQIYSTAAMAITGDGATWKIDSDLASDNSESMVLNVIINTDAKDKWGYYGLHKRTHKENGSNEYIFGGNTISVGSKAVKINTDEYGITTFEITFSESYRIWFMGGKKEGQYEYPYMYIVKG